MTHLRAMPLAADAQQRLDALRRFLVVDAPEEDELARLVRVAATVYGVSYAVLMLRDGPSEGDGAEATQRVAAAFGTDVDGFGEDSALIDGVEDPPLPMTVADATDDKRFARNPLVKSGKAKFYAGVPLRSAQGFTIGTLAVFDPEPQELNGEGLSLLVDIGALVEPVLNQREFQRERNAAVAVSDAATKEQATAAAAREAAASERDTAYAERDAARAERDAVAAERDALKAGREALEAERDVSLESARVATEARTATAAARDAAIAEREAAVAERDASVTDRDTAATMAAAVRAEAEAAAHLRDAAVAERDAARAERDASLAQRGTEADEVRTAIAERDAARAERDAATTERDAGERELSRLQAALDTLAAERDRAIKIRDAATTERDAANAAREAAGAGPWSALLGSTPAPIVVSGPDGALLYANDRARMLLGLGEDPTGDSLSRIVASDDSERLATLLSDPAARPTEISITDATGALRPVRVSVAPAPALGDRAVMLVVRTLETERRLADALREREAALARAAAAAPAPPPDGIVTTVRNEVHASLAALAEYSGLQQTQATDAETREMATAVGGVATRLLRVLEGTFGLAGFNGGGGLVPVEVAPALEKAAGHYRPAADARDLAFVVDVAEDGACAWGDPESVGHVLDALISNAVSHTVRGGVRMRLTHDDDRVVVEVQDTGVGMDAETLACVLAGPPSGILRPGGGIGLGLALARRLADRMGAEITGHSVPGQGSVFRLSLRPAARAAETAGGDGVAAPEGVAA